VLEDWPGAIVVASHERAFLERTVTDVLVLDETHPGIRVPGGYAAWEADRRARRGRGAARPAPTVGPSPAAATRSRPAPPTLGGRRSPSTLRYLLKDVEKDMRRLERRRGQITGEVAAAAADHVALARLGEALAAVETDITAVEDRWLELTTEADAEA
jgi:ATP-binding cassette subfamily F protein uup